MNGAKFTAFLKLFIASCLLSLPLSFTAPRSSAAQDAAGSAGLRPALLEPTPTAPAPTQLIPFSVPTTNMPGENIFPSATAEGPLSLADSLNASLLESPRMAGVRALLGIAKSAYPLASAMPNPGIYMSNVFHNNYFLGASIPVEPPWKLAFRLLVAKHQVKQAKLEIEKTMWQFRGEVRRNYVELVMAQEMASARQILMNLSERILAVAKKHFENGDVPGLDVRRAKLAFIQAKMDYQQAVIQVEQAKQQVNLNMARPAEATIAVPRLPEPRSKLVAGELLPDFGQPLPSRQQFVDMAISNRLELKILKEAILTNRANLNNTLGNILPTPRFVVGQGLELNPPPPGPIQRIPFMQAYIDAPVFNWQQGDIARFKATGKQLKLDLKAQENVIAAQASLAYEKLLAGREKIRTYHEEALGESDAISKIAKDGYELGQLSANTLLDAQRANIQVKSQYLDAVLAYHLALNELEQAVGKPLQ
jgi:outer membrane protein, heavy metal efflux system